MLNIRSSMATAKNPRFKEQPRLDGGNVSWLQRCLPSLQKRRNTCLLLVGGTSTVDFRLRVAQSHARDDLTPSHWSHVALLDHAASPLGQTALWEVSLQPAKGFEFPPKTNAVQKGTLEHYDPVAQYPNIAVIGLPLRLDEVTKNCQRFSAQRSILDTVEQLMLWLSFVWGVGRAGNPLLDGQGIPSATMVEYVAGAAGFELTPGLASRSSCPEAIWQSASWWHKYYLRESRNKSLEGFWYAPHVLGGSPEDSTFSGNGAKTIAQRSNKGGPNRRR